MSNLTTIPGVGQATAKKLEQGGVDNVDAVAEATLDLIVSLTGFYGARAEAIHAAARELAEVAPIQLMEASPDPEPTKGSKAEKKARKLLAEAAKLRKAAKKAKKAGKPKRAAKKKKAAKRAEKKARKGLG